MSGWVTVTGPPLAICSRNLGITLPEEPSTLPKRTATKRGVGACRCKTWQAISARRLLAPMTLVGFTALSVEIRTNSPTLLAAAARATVKVPCTLLRTACHALAPSISGTCL